MVKEVKGKKVKSVYIASPYTKPEGKQLQNTEKSFDVASELIDLGFIPYAPLWSHYLHERHPKNWETWMELDLYWLEKCDCLLRLPGESKGADIEVEHAHEKGIPVFYEIDDLKKNGGVMK